MTMLRPIAIMTVLTATVAGCVGLPDEEDIREFIADRATDGATKGDSDDSTLDTFQANRDTFGNMPNTAFTGIPDTGGATFTGAAQFTIEPLQGNTPERRYVGRATLGVEFENGQMIGRMDNFTRRGEGTAVTGNLSIRDGEIGVNRPNDMAARYFGDLRDRGDNISVDSRMSGSFVGTPIKGIVANDEGEAGSFNGRPSAHSLEIYLERN